MRLAGRVLLCGALALAAGRRAQATDPLQVAVEDGAAPWSAADGSGFANDLVVAAFRAAGVEVELLVVPYERCKRMVLQGDAPACFSMSAEPALAELVSFPADPLFTCTAQFFEAVARPLPASRQEDLPPGTLVATARDYEYPPRFRELERAGRIQVEEAVTEAVALQRLAAGRVALALVMVDQAIKRPTQVVQQAGVSGDVRTTFIAGINRSFIGFSRKHPRGAWALARFEEGFRRIRASGEARRIETAWSARAGGAPPPSARTGR